MENMVIESCFNGLFKDMPVLVTGHTGFKGSWLSIWLKELGANVIGYSLEPPTQPSNFESTHLKNRIVDIRGDIRNVNKIIEVIDKYKPKIVFHLAAQAIVLKSFDQPLETFYTNTGGSVNMLEAIRRTDSVKALVSITSDKCYKNQEQIWSYRENDLLGGDDLYSASKAMAELAISSYRKSFFANKKYAGYKNVAVASTRAGNVIGGGDFADFRLVPDCMRALMKNEPIIVRNPRSTRPWQHVLVPLSGYLWLAVKLLEDGEKYSEAWNFGPLENVGVTAREIAEKSVEFWKDGTWKHEGVDDGKIEMNLLSLNWEKAANILKWKAGYNWKEGIEKTVDWFKEYQKQMNLDEIDMYDFCVKQIKEYTVAAQEREIPWALPKNKE